MLTDWILVRRLAGELDRELHGERIREAGRLADGRFGLRVRRGLIAVDVFGPTPVVTLDAQAPLERSAGWVRTMADALEGLRIERVRARHGDRLLALECSALSRFGVESGYRLVAELVPRFGNVLLLKDDVVVSAAKEFAHGENARRSISAGERYEPPPLPEAPRSDDLAGALRAYLEVPSATTLDRASRALRAGVPLLPRLLADAAIAESRAAAGASPDALARRCLARAEALVARTDGEPAALGDVYAYRDGERLVQCHVVALAQFDGLRLERAPQLLPLLTEAVVGATVVRAAGAFEARRAGLQRRIDKRLALLAARRTELERERDDAGSRDAQRLHGDLLYAHLADVPAGAASFVPPSAPGVTIALDPALDAKANAAAIFKRYRKAVGKLEHVAQRLTELERDERFAGQLGWELERAESDTLDDVAEGVERLERRKAAAPRERARKRRPLEVRLAPDARIYVGRSPAGNAHLTFGIARPDDLWFHARATPGAHVVLHLDSQREPSAGELEAAASLAAYHSKARAAGNVSVDFTLRKYVRRQAGAPPGLVWYTNARTLYVAPSATLAAPA